MFDAYGAVRWCVENNATVEFTPGRVMVRAGSGSLLWFRGDTLTEAVIRAMDLEPETNRKQADG